MKNYTHDYRDYNTVSYKIMDEKGSLDNFKDELARDLSKAEIKEHGKTTEQLAKYCHGKNVYYPITIYENGIPICFMENYTKVFAVRILDERLFWYVDMGYKKDTDGRMFLYEIWIREYMHKEATMLHDLKGDQHFEFTTKGGLKITTETIIREGETKIERTIEEAKKPINVSKNWQKIPEFGDYYYLADYKNIIKAGDFLKEIK